MMLETIESIRDDITTVCCYNTEIHPQAREAKYYLEPDWKSIFSRQKRILYPDLDTDTGSMPSVADISVTKATGPAVNRHFHKIKQAFGKLLKKVKRDA